MLYLLNTHTHTHTQRARTAKKIESPADIEGFLEMKDEEKDEIKKLIAEFDAPKPASKATKTGGKTAKSAAKVSSGSTQTLLSSPAKPTTSGMYICTLISMTSYMYIKHSPD